MIVPPTFEDLEKRLRGRNTESEESIKRRLVNAQNELSYADKPGFFDYIITNDNIELAYEQLKQWIFGGKSKI